MKLSNNGVQVRKDGVVISSDSYENYICKVNIFPFVYYYTYSLLHTTINIETLYKSGNTNFNITLLLIRQPRQ